MTSSPDPAVLTGRTAPPAGPAPTSGLTAQAQEPVKLNSPQVEPVVFNPFEEGASFALFVLSFQVLCARILQTNSDILELSCRLCQ